jgi:hypothetical protein
MGSPLLAVAATLRDVALFALATFGLGAACGPRRIADPLLRLAAGLVIALGLMFAVGFAGFAAGLPNHMYALATVVVGVGVLGLRWSAARELGATKEVRHFLGGWLVFAAWSLGLLAAVVSYSGGGWVADWVEHWQRTVFFLERQPLTTRFAGIYSLTARPPLANLLVALGLESGAPTFARFQVFMTLFGTLVLLPVWALARRWSGAANAGAWTVPVLMCNPLVAENLTFAWTKVPTAFFVLTAVALLASVLEQPSARTERIAAAISLGLAVLTHYSAVPWVIALTIAFLAAAKSVWGSSGFRRDLAIGTVAFVAIVATWLGWSIHTFGLSGTVGSTTTAGAWEHQSMVEHISVPLRNLVDTLVPFPLRGEPHDGLIAQASQLGRARDVAFNVYQLTLPFAFGLAGLWCLTMAARKRRFSDRTPAGQFYRILVPVVIVLGIVVHTPRDEWGLVHICLQPLVLLGLGLAAAQLANGSRRIVAVWSLLAALDVALGVALQFALESGRFAPVAQLSRAAMANANDKAAFGFTFFADLIRVPPTVLVLWLALCIGAAILPLRRVPPPAA